MKNMKLLGLLVIAAAALMAFVGTASATELTSPKGTKLEVGAVVKAQSEGSITLDGTVKITCTNVTGDGKITNAGGPSATVDGLPNLVVWTGCGSGDTITVLKTGSGELHSLGGGEGTLTSSGAEITVQLHRSVLGFPITTHCIYRTENTHVGRVKDSSVTGSTPTVEIGTTPIAQVATDGACGNDAVLTGNVVVSSPDLVYID